MKPVELVVTNTLYEILSNIETLPPEIQDKVKASTYLTDNAGYVARHILLEISQSASLPIVYKALAAINAPSTPDEISHRMQAVVDQTRDQAAP